MIPYLKEDKIELLILYKLQKLKVISLRVNQIMFIENISKST